MHAYGAEEVFMCSVRDSSIIRVLASLNLLNGFYLAYIL